MRRLILGTAGHIDHGKTALVRALTGVDTDRLKEEKARGITIELGFAELALPEARYGVVDVPGHEDFVRAMVAGATGIDVVLLVVAADEGVMPQTREHLAIVELLGVEAAIVALTKCDAVDEEWLELVRSEVGDALAQTPFADAPLIATSSVSGDGLDELRAALQEAARAARPKLDRDLLRLPLDRVFTIQGTGTVATGTVWTGRVGKGDRVRVEPGGLEARVRGVQVHAEEVESASAGDRAAVALTGDGGDRERVTRGATLVSEPAWSATSMLTARVRLLPDTPWTLDHNQRVRAHVGTAEVLARVALLESAALGPGQSGWVQLRLEQPLLARARDRIVLRAYSPVTTIGGGAVAEPTPPKRKHLGEDDREALRVLLDGDDPACLGRALDLASWRGSPERSLPVLTGLTPERVEAAAGEELTRGALRVGGALFATDVVRKGRALLAERVQALHAEDPLRETVPLASVRTALPSWAARELADALLDLLCAEGVLLREEGGVRAVDHQVELAPEQRGAAERLSALFREAGLASPWVDELPPDLAGRSDLWSLLRYLQATGTLTAVSDVYFVDSTILEAAITQLRGDLGGGTGLGPSDFRAVFPVTRKHLIPLLNFLDGEGVTVRREDGRDVPA